MSGSIPAGLALLQNLEYLDLSSCQFSGPVPASFQNLAKLRHLELRFNSLQSPLPDLSTLTNLQYFDLGINQFSEDLPAWLWKMAGLSRLYAYGAGFTGQLPDDVSKLSGLVTLNLGANKLTGPIPAALFNLKNLRFLDLQYNQLTGSLPFQVGQLSDLYSLYALLAPTYSSAFECFSNMFSCRERDLDPASICEHGLEQLPYCSGASSFLPPATVAARPDASRDIPAPKTTSNVSPAVYACLPVLFLLGAAIAWVAASRCYRSKASMTHPSTSPKDQEMAVQPKHVHDDAQSYYLPEHMEPLLHLIAWGMPLVLTIVPMALAAQTGLPLFGDAQLWCGMRREYGTYRLAFYYGIVIAALALCLLIYLAVGIRVWQQTAEYALCLHDVGQSQLTKCRNKSVKTASKQHVNVRGRFALRSTLYFASFFITWIFAAVNRVRAILDPTAPPLVWLIALHATFKPAHGAMNALSYFAPLVYSKYFARSHSKAAAAATSSTRGTKVLATSTPLAVEGDDDRRLDKGAGKGIPAVAADFPEGGKRAWLVVLGSALISFSSFGVINSFGEFQYFYKRDYLADYSNSAISIIGSLQISLLYVCGLFAGNVFDMTGVKYLYPIGGFGTVLSLVLLSFTQPGQYFQQLLVQGIMLGLAVGCGFYPALSIVSHYFSKRRALAMGLVAAGSSVGGVCFPVLIHQAIPSIGFAWTVRIVALLCGVCYGVAFLLARTRLPPKPAVPLRRLIDFGGYTDRRYLAYAVGGFLINMVMYLPYYYIQHFAELHGVSDSVAGYLLSVINGASFFGRIIAGLLGDRYGRANILCPFTILCGVLCFVLWMPATGAVAMIAFCALYGFFSGGFISVFPACVAQISPPESIGTRIGTFFGVISFATLLGPPIGGAFLSVDTLGSYQHLIIFTGAMSVLGGVGLCVARYFCSPNLKDKW
ncbi:hypothetical protein RI367_001627 [Sorochytrium milnesiophthora]